MMHHEANCILQRTARPFLPMRASELPRTQFELVGECIGGFRDERLS